jgi:hypothetical protein
VDGDLVAIEGQGPGAHGIARRSAPDEIGQARIGLLDHGGRDPIRLDIFAIDSRPTRPGLTRFAHRDRIGQGHAIPLQQKKAALALADDEGACRQARMGGGRRGDGGPRL